MCVAVNYVKGLFNLILNIECVTNLKAVRHAKLIIFYCQFIVYVPCFAFT